MGESEKANRKSERSTLWQLGSSETAAGWSSMSLLDYSIIRVPTEAVWTEHTVSSDGIITLKTRILNLFLTPPLHIVPHLYTVDLLVCRVLVRAWGPSYLNRSLLFANIVGLQLLRLWQCSADRRPKTDNWDKRAAVELLVTLMITIMMMTILIILHCWLLCKNIPQTQTGGVLSQKKGKEVLKWNDFFLF